MSETLYSLKMRASLAGRHVSGAERIVGAQAVPCVVAQLATRAMKHDRGGIDSLNIKMAALGEVRRIKALEVSTIEASTPVDGWRKVEEILSNAGFSRAKEIRSLFCRTYSMRGAMLLDADTLEDLTPDSGRGVRATNMDSALSPRADRKNHFAEALVLASKVLAAPGIVGEICMSDDPSYVTGYVATREGGYQRITCLKEMGDEAGGRIFLYRGRKEDVAETVRFLQEEPVIVEGVCAKIGEVAKDRYASLEDDLAAAEAAGLKRRIAIRPKALVSFASNDYLGLANDERVKAAAANAAMEYGAGTGASRLVTGTQAPHLALEAHIARFKKAEDAIVFSTGYMANLGAISSIVGKDDVVLSDELNHASIIDGCRMSGAKVIVYPHLDMEALERKLGACGAFRRRLVVSDGVFSMDGDALDIAAFCAICKRFDALSMVDEAHSTGVLGLRGGGLSELCAPGEKPDLMMGTLSKALGAEGGYVAGNAVVIEYLRQFARSFIFNTAPCAASMAAADKALEILEREPEVVQRLHGNIKLFLEALGMDSAGAAEGRRSAIVPLIIGDERKALEVSARLESAGFVIPAIRYPTVARGAARLRVAISASHSPSEILSAAKKVKEFLPQ
ncbi:MAG: aminotransferase class I/II-fold pyridoxal phosphate-dependent enzyme [Kiritimatiellae bacterium]|nr:aminotransferase class I/II-fold pyridoxal phosphate-dependent enzyme [Kiritimatiellia bacterium]